MPIIKSAQKALRQNISRRKRNLKKGAELKRVIKEYKKLITAEHLSQVYKKLDKAAKVNLIKRNKAARLKSKLSKLLTK